MQILADGIDDVPNLLVNDVSLNVFVIAFDIRDTHGRTAIPRPSHLGAMIAGQHQPTKIAATFIAL